MAVVGWEARNLHGRVTTTFVSAPASASSSTPSSASERRKSQSSSSPLDCCWGLRSWRSWPGAPEHRNKDRGHQCESKPTRRELWNPSLSKKLPSKFLPPINVPRAYISYGALIFTLILWALPNPKPRSLCQPMGCGATVPRPALPQRTLLS